MFENQREKMHNGKRLAEILEEKGVSAKDLADRLGVSRQNIYNTINTKTIGEVRLQKICKVLGVDVNEFYLQPKSYLKAEETTPLPLQESAVPYEASNIIMVPFVSQYAYGSYLQGFSDPEYVDDLPKIAWPVTHDPKGVYKAIEVRGDSMDDGTAESFQPGDIVLGRLIQRHLWRDRLRLKRIFVINHMDGMVIKQVVAHNTEKAEITLHSLNEQYEDYTISLNDVREIYHVIKQLKNR